MAATDLFENHATGLDAPAEAGMAISPSDSTALSHVTRAVYIGAGGDLRGIMHNGTEVTLRGLPAGMLLPIRISRVWATGTTASNLVALW